MRSVLPSNQNFPIWIQISRVSKLILPPNQKPKRINNYYEKKFALSICCTVFSKARLV